MKTLRVRSRREWRSWLRKHHDTDDAIWLVFLKRHAGRDAIRYEDAVEEAICYGWIDSLIKRIDDDTYARKFTPRKPDSRWSAINRRRYARLASQGLLAEPGRERAPTSRTYAPKPSVTAAIPPYIEERLRRNRRAWIEFEKLPPSERRACIGWIDLAKREETREKRLREAVRLLAAGKRLGLK